MSKKKFFIVTTMAQSLGFFSGQLKMLNATFDVCAISSTPELLKKYGKSEGIRTHNIPMKRSISFFWDIWCLLCFIVFFLKERPSIVHGNTPKGAMLSMMASWLTHRPVRIYMCHGLRYQGATGLMRKLLMQIERLTCACATEILCVSRGLADRLIADGVCTANKARVIGFGSAGGIDLERFSDATVDASQVRTELGFSDKDFVFCFVGRIVKDKGVNELVEAFNRLNKEYKHIHLLLIGPYESNQDPVKQQTINLINDNKNIHNLGLQLDVRPYIKASNALVLPSYREGFGMVLIEAGALGIPSITTNIIGCNEIVVCGENGDTIEPRNTEQLYDKMKDWVINCEKVSTMGCNARRLVEKRFDCHYVWALYIEEYKRLAESC